MENTQESLCRPDNKHYCVTCCTGRECSLVGELPDGTEGCLGHNGEISDGLTQTNYCRGMSCILTNRLDEVKTAVSNLPKGRFNMNDVLKKIDR